MVALAYTVAFEGIEARLVEVQCTVAPGMKRRPHVPLKWVMGRWLAGGRPRAGRRDARS